MSRRGGSGSDPQTIIVGLLVVFALLSAAGTWIGQHGGPVHAAAEVWDRIHDDGPPPADLAALKVAAPRDGGYHRTAAQWGQTWYDADRNGCDTRNDVLRRDLTGPELRPGSRCVVVAGTLHDPYTATTITFRKATAAAVQIDHVVPLAEAWRSGARDWTLDQRRAYANDPLVLLAVDGPANESKGDRAPDKWRPTHGQCPYATRYVQIKTKWRLTVTTAERAALTKMLRVCP